MEQQNITVEKKSRPGMLIVVCIISLVWTGLMSLLWLTGVLASGWLGSIVESYLPGGGSAVAQYFSIFCGVFLLFYVLKFWGVIKMLCLKKSGFVIYIIPSTLLLLLQVLLIMLAPVSVIFIGLLVISILFIILYSMNLKHMR